MPLALSRRSRARSVEISRCHEGRRDRRLPVSRVDVTSQHASEMIRIYGLRVANCVVYWHDHGCSPREGRRHVPGRARTDRPQGGSQRHTGPRHICLALCMCRTSVTKCDEPGNRGDPAPKSEDMCVRASVHPCGHRWGTHKSSFTVKLRRHDVDQRGNQGFEKFLHVW